MCALDTCVLLCYILTSFLFPFYHIFFQISTCDIDYLETCSKKEETLNALQKNGYNFIIEAIEAVRYTIREYIALYWSAALVLAFDFIGLVPFLYLGYGVFLLKKAAGHTRHGRPPRIVGKVECEGIDRPRQQGGKRAVQKTEAVPKLDMGKGVVVEWHSWDISLCVKRKDSF